MVFILKFEDRIPGNVMGMNSGLEVTARFVWLSSSLVPRCDAVDSAKCSWAISRDKVPIPFHIKKSLIGMNTSSEQY